jgi:hypothetical protein
VGVDVHDGEGAVVAGHRPEDRVGDAVVAAHRDRLAAVPVDGLELLGDPGEGLLDLERRGPDISVVGDPDLLVDGQLEDRVVDPDLARGIADGSRSQPGPHAIAGRGVEGHTHEHDVEVPRVREMRQSHEGRDARVARIDHAVDRLGMSHVEHSSR